MSWNTSINGYTVPFQSVAGLELGATSSDVLDCVTYVTYVTMRL